MPSNIQQFLKKIRHQLADFNLLNGIIRLLQYLLPALLLVILTETIFYLDPSGRTKLVVMVLAVSTSLLVFLITSWLINRNGYFGNSSDRDISRYAGEKLPGISDRLLNVYQLEKNLSAQQQGKDLADYAIRKMTAELGKVDPGQLKDPVKPSRWYMLAGVMAVTLITAGIFWHHFQPALIRLMHPNTEYPVPMPFTLISLTENQNVLGGDSLYVAFTGAGQLPDSLQVKWLVRGVERKSTVNLEDETYSFLFPGINADIVYWSEYESKSWFTPWDRISTTPDTIFVTDRPVVENLQFTIIPPIYTREEPWKHPGNVTDVTLLAGSHVQINASATKHLEMAWVLIGDERKSLEVSLNRIHGSFPLVEDETVAIYCMDENSVGNLNPAQYRFAVIPDYPPDLLVAKPDRETALDESMLIHFSMQVSDDFGFSGAELKYKIKHPDYISQDTITYQRTIPELLEDARSQQVFHTWDLSGLRLAPDDEVRFQIYVSDNNTLTGPSKTASAVFTARYPSLEDLYMSLSESEDTTEEESEQIMMTLEDVKELVEELELELLKSDEVDWEQTQKADQILNKMEDVMEQVQSLQEGMEKINEQLEKNNLVNDDLQEKFSKLQELLDQILTPELMEAMEKLREAMDQMNPEQMMQALENFDFNVEELEEQLDRFIDMFEQAIAEQQMDEVVKRLEEMVQEQTDIVEEIDKEDGQPLSELASRERRQEEKFQKLEDVMQTASEAMEKFAAQPSEDLKQLSESELKEQTGDSLNEAREEMQQNSGSCNKPAGEAKEGLEEMLKQAQSIQENFQSQTVAEMMKDFQRVLQNTLSISQNQEYLRANSKRLRSNSPKLQEIASTQDRIRRQTTQLFAQLMELSRKTFYISPPISRALGKAKLAMDKTISQIEQKRVSTAQMEQGVAMEGLNEAARLMLDAMEEMQSSGSASGFDSFMEQMQQMSQQQQGINQGTMQMGQMGMMAQQEMMRRLQQQQQALQQSLNELLSEMPGEEGGGLSKASEEMDEVIKDFKRRQVTRDTQDRQERILSRMLDSQKSMKQRDYSKKRKSNTGEEFLYSGPAGLPTGLGERELLLIKAMEDALNEGYSREYQSMMKTYFRELQKNTDQQIEPGLEN